MTVTHVMIGKCYLCHDTEQLRSTLGFTLAARLAGSMNSTWALLWPPPPYGLLDVVLRSAGF
jgi:hypothetical protein